MGIGSTMSLSQLMAIREVKIKKMKYLGGNVYQSLLSIYVFT